MAKKKKKPARSHTTEKCPWCNTIVVPHHLSTIYRHSTNLLHPCSLVNWPGLILSASWPINLCSYLVFPDAAVCPSSAFFPPLSCPQHAICMNKQFVCCFSVSVSVVLFDTCIHKKHFLFWAFTAVFCFTLALHSMPPPETVSSDCSISVNDSDSSVTFRFHWSQLCVPYVFPAQHIVLACPGRTPCSCGQLAQFVASVEPLPHSSFIPPVVPQRT